MQFGITTSKIDEIGLITRAENLGYDFCWVSDTQMIRSNPWAVLALAAQQTRSIRIGTGVAVAGLRLAPVTANGIATINRLAPGRTFLGMGTGNTAMRAMGQPPMGVKAFEDYIRIPQQFACDDLEETERMVGEQLKKSTSNIFLVGIGHVKSGLLHRLTKYTNAVFLDVGSSLDAIAGIIDVDRPYFGDWTNYQIDEKNLYEGVDFLQYDSSRGKHITLERS